MIKTIRAACDFFLFSSLYIALCAVVMIWQTDTLLLGTPPPFSVCGFVFFATICSYNFHWYLTPSSVTSSQRIRWAQQHKGWHLFLYFIGIAGSLAFFVMISTHWIALAFAALLTFLYSAPKLPQPVFKSLKKIAIGKTVFLSFVWMYVTTILPLLVAGAQWKTIFTLFALSRLFLIYAICILFDYRDREDDRNDGIRSMITWLSDKGIRMLFNVSLLLFALFTLCMNSFGFGEWKAFILLMPGIAVYFLYNISKKYFSDYLYYFVLDGMMMFSGLVMLVVRI